MNFGFNFGFSSGGSSGPPGSPLFYYDGSELIIAITDDDYGSVASDYQDIFFSAGPTVRDIGDILTDISASEFINDGGELIYNSDTGKAILYADDTSPLLLIRGYLYADEVFPLMINPDNSIAVNPDDSVAHNPTV